MQFFKKNNQPDALSVNMQNEIIFIAEERLQKPLSKILIDRVRNPRWSYMGLEMIIDTVKTIDINMVESYLSNLS